MSEPSVSDRITTSILNSCRKVDPNAELSACSRDHHGRTLVQVTASATHTATELASALRTLMPLAIVKTVQDLRTGETVARLTVPTAEDEWDLAHEKASDTTSSRLLRRLSFSFLILGLGAWVALAFTANSEDRDI